MQRLATQLAAPTQRLSLQSVSVWQTAVQKDGTLVGSGVRHFMPSTQLLSSAQGSVPSKDVSVVPETPK